MSLLTSSIDLDTIAKPTSEEIPQFKKGQIEDLANLFLQAGDTVRPIILRKISSISFQVLEGHFEYYAALKAQEIDEQFTAIRAYVVPPELESTIVEQYRFLRSLSLSTPIESAPTHTHEGSQNLEKMEQSITQRLEQKLTATIERRIEEQMSFSLQVIVNQMTKQLDTHLIDFKQSLSLVPVSKIFEPEAQPSSLVPELGSQNISKTDKLTETKTKPKTKPKVESPTTIGKSKNLDDNTPKRLEILNDLNTMNFADLERKLANSGKGNIKFARPIHEQRSQELDQKFAAIEDVIKNVKMLGEKTMQKIIDSW